MTRFVNNVKTVVLLGGLFGLILLAGYLMGGYAGITIAFIFGAIMNFGAYFYSDKIAIKAMRGQQIDPHKDSDLIEMVGRLAKSAGLPMPKVYVCP